MPSDPVSFGASVYAAGRVSQALPLAWVILPARLVGVVALTLPLALGARLRLTRRATPLVFVSGLCEVGGFLLFGMAARHGIAIAAVLGSQFAALSALAAFALFRERLARIQVLGVAAILVGVSVLSGLQA
jgi:drug/metabolite transporter (DMT)-like permease